MSKHHPASDIRKWAEADVGVRIAAKGAPHQSYVNERSHPIPSEEYNLESRFPDKVVCPFNSLVAEKAEVIKGSIPQRDPRTQGYPGRFAQVRSFHSE